MPIQDTHTVRLIPLEHVRSVQCVNHIKVVPVRLLSIDAVDWGYPHQLGHQLVTSISDIR